MPHLTRPELIRKTVAFAVVLLLAGLAPAAGVIGSCARMPCCNHGPGGVGGHDAGTVTDHGAGGVGGHGAGLVGGHGSGRAGGGLSPATTNCCTAITCYDSPAAKLTARTGSGNAAGNAATVVLPVAVAHSIASPQAAARRDRLDSSPPRAGRHRLAILSTLLI